MPLSEWKPTSGEVPSSSRKGETRGYPIHVAVGAALSEWEHMESGLARLFQLLCESPSLAAARAYGTLESSFAKMGMLRAASDVFFSNRGASDSNLHNDMKALFSAYQTAQQYRNNIAHGMVIGFHISRGNHSGYFLCPPSYATKKVKRLNPKEVYLLGATYWYSPKDIQHYAKRFTEMLSETMRLIQVTNQEYGVLKTTTTSSVMDSAIGR